MSIFFLFISFGSYIKKWIVLSHLHNPSYTIEYAKKIGRLPLNTRKVFNGILWIFKSGARWRNLPTRYGN
ncbi:MAG: transposase [Quinella sp. 3Q1]|nr:transposase [Quinella sp. 3Q1]